MDWSYTLEQTCEEDGWADDAWEISAQANSISALAVKGTYGTIPQNCLPMPDSEVEFFLIIYCW